MPREEQAEPATIPIRGDEGDRREMRTIFTQTGHHTLNALLIISGGATVAFLTLLGEAVKQHDLVTRIGAPATRELTEALTSFFFSVLLAVLAYGTTYASHAAYHYSATFSRNPTISRPLHVVGQLFMWGTVAVCTLCFVFLWRGGFSAIEAFGSVADAITRTASVPMPTK